MRYLACFAIVALLPIAAYADCGSEEAKVQNMITQMAQKLNSHDVGFCAMGKEAERVFRHVLAFYERCPINDPDGNMRQYSVEMIEWGRETQRQACN